MGSVVAISLLLTQPGMKARDGLNSESDVASDFLRTVKDWLLLSKTCVFYAKNHRLIREVDLAHPKFYSFRDIADALLTIPMKLRCVVDIVAENN